MSELRPNIKWLGHASILIETSKGNILVDPWKLSEIHQAELVLITHSHFDHLSIDDINKCLAEGKVVIAPPDCLKSLESKYDCLEIKPDEKIELDWVKVVATRAYNRSKDFHPLKNNWVGYIITVDGQSIYIAGDTDLINEMKEIKADIAILPVGGTYTMNYIEAAQAAQMIKPKLAIPIHFGDIVGEKNYGQKFAQLLKDIPVKILEPESKYHTHE